VLEKTLMENTIFGKLFPSFIKSFTSFVRMSSDDIAEEFS